MPIMEISVVPLGTKTVSVSAYVADSIKVLEKQKGIRYELTSMGTIIEGNSSKELLNIANEMHTAMFEGNIQRVLTTIKIDDRRDKKLTISGKVSSLLKKIQDKK